MTSTIEAALTAEAFPVSSSQSLLLRTDVRGRVRTPRDQRQAILQEFERSGLSGAEFARLVGVKYSTFAGWLHQRRSASKQSKSGPRAAASKSSAPMRLVEAVVDPGLKSNSGSCPPVQLQLAKDIRLEVSCVAQLPLVKALVEGLRSMGGSC